MYLVHVVDYNKKYTKVFTNLYIPKGIQLNIYFVRIMTIAQNHNSDKKNILLNAFRLKNVYFVGPKIFLLKINHIAEYFT